MKTKFLALLVLTFSQFAFCIDGILLKTTDYSFRDKWDNTFGKTVPKIFETDVVYRGQNLFLPVISMDFALKDGAAKAKYSIQIKKPDQSIYMSEDNLDFIDRKIINKDYLQMSTSVVRISFTDKDVLGKYAIQVTINDLNSNKTKVITSEIELKPLVPYQDKVFNDDNDFSRWLSEYYIQPKPTEAVAAYLYYTKSKFSEDDKVFLSIFSEFLEITRNNTFILPQILEAFKKEDDKCRIFLLYLLYPNFEEKDYIHLLNDKEKGALEKVKEMKIPDIYGEVYSGEQLDMLWSTFMGSGAYKPILKLVETLDYAKYKGDLEKYKTSSKTEEDKKKAIKNAVYDALVWSLESNSKQHELVLNYCNWILKYENLNPTQKSELEEILKKVGNN